MKLSATVKEAVADAEVEISQEAVAQADPGAPRPRTRQDGGAEQPDVCQRPAHLRLRDPRVRRLVLLGASSRVQPDRCASLPDSPGTPSILSVHDPPPVRIRSR